MAGLPCADCGGQDTMQPIEDPEYGVRRWGPHMEGIKLVKCTECNAIAGEQAILDVLAQQAAEASEE